MIAAIGLLFAITVAHDAPLRSSCDSDEASGSIPAGTQVEIRFAVADGSNCYKVAAVIAGKSVLGYIDGSALSSTQAFDDQRRAGASLGGGGQSRSEDRELALKLAPASTARPIVDLLNSHQPGRALDEAEALLKKEGRNRAVLGLAAIAAYQNDDLRRAAGYCQDAQAGASDSPLAAFCNRVDREVKADQSGEKLYGMRVAVRYEGEKLPADVARSMVSLLDQEFIRISGELGCTAEERIVAIVQSRDAYLRTTNAAEWSGGQYDGRIHVSLPPSQTFGPETRRTFAHETVHACLANLGRFPAWLHEGLAQKLSGDALSGTSRAELQETIRSGAVPKLENLGQNWSGMSTKNARLAYNLALAAAGVLVENYANYGIRNLLRNPGMLDRITPEIDKALGL